MYQKELENNKLRKEEKYYYAKKSCEFSPSNLFYFIKDDYDKWLNNNDYSKTTIYMKVRSCIYFLKFIEKKEIKNISDIDKEIIDNYIQEIPNYYRSFTINNFIKELRLFLRFLYQKKYINVDLSLLVPKRKINGNSNIPSYWTTENINLLIQNIERETIIGKRFYLVVMLAFNYGLRNSDIINLKLDNIDWKNRKIKLTQRKTNNEITLPLLENIEDALIDYIVNARPTTSSRNVVLKLDGTEIDHYNFYDMMKRTIKKANIEVLGNQKIGIHSLRHTLASNLLKEQIPINIISNVLGHTSIEVTMKYLKIDKNSLEKCCLNIEGEANE